MWVFLSNAMLSIVDERQHTLDRMRDGGGCKAKPLNVTPSKTLLVRARMPGDIERVFGKAHTVERSDDSDYMFRARIPRVVVAAVIKNQVLGIDYGNFKSSVNDIARSAAYMGVWSAAMRLQPPRRQRGRRRGQRALFDSVSYPDEIPRHAYTDRRPKWMAAEVQRPDAGNLYNAVEIATDRECGLTPTHSRKLAEELAAELNVRALAEPQPDGCPQCGKASGHYSYCPRREA